MRIQVESGRITTVSDAIPALNSPKLMRRLHAALAAEYQVLVQAGFEGEASPAGTPWKQLAPATVRRRKGKNAHPILRVSGRLARTHVKVSAECAIVGSNLVYAAIHQYGGEIRREGGKITLHFKKFKRGPRKGRTLFAKPGKATWGMQANAGPYTIRIPARPWLFEADGTIPAAWMQRLETCLIKSLEARHA